VPYSSKYKKYEFDKFVFILTKLKEKSNIKFEKKEFVVIIKLVYGLNPEGIGKRRKRTLSEILHIIENKSFPCNAGESQGLSPALLGLGKI
jgi:hypothetical protein